MKRVLIVDDMHDSIIPLLSEAGYEAVYSPKIDRREILEVIHDFFGLIIRSKTEVNQELIDKAKKLKFVARAGAGTDKVEKKYLLDRGIELINAPEGNRDSLGEHALGMILSLLHRIPHAYDEIKDGKWDREGNRGIELKGKVVGIYGVGHMGSAVAQKLSGFECEVIGYDIKNEVSSQSLTLVGIEDFMERVEILSIHVPLTKDTVQLFDKAYLKRFKKLKVVINTARGEVLNTKDLLELLEQQVLYGACLDVLQNEKLPSYSEDEKQLLQGLTALPNVIITPHVGGWTYESYERINQVIIDKLNASFHS